MKSKIFLVVVLMIGCSGVHAQNEKTKAANKAKGQLFLNELIKKQNSHQHQARAGYQLPYPHLSPSQKASTSNPTDQKEQQNKRTPKMPVVVPKSTHTLPVAVPDSTVHHHLKIVK